MQQDGNNRTMSEKLVVLVIALILGCGMLVLVGISIKEMINSLALLIEFRSPSELFKQFSLAALYGGFAVVMLLLGGLISREVYLDRQPTTQSQSTHQPTTLVVVEGSPTVATLSHLTVFTDTNLAATIYFMFSRRSPENVAFHGVALFIIIVGIVFLSIGSVQLIGQMLWQWSFGWPLAKVMAGLIIIALGYIILELELIRRKLK